MSNLYLFAGEEQYGVYHEVKRWKDNFSEKFGSDSIFEYKGDRNAAEAVSALQGGGLFASKKLVILWGVPQDTIASNKIKVAQIESVFPMVMQLAENEGSDVLVLCVSYKPDKRKKEFKWLTKNAEVKTFKPLKGVGLRKRTMGKMEGRGEDEKIPVDVVDHLLSLTGNDLRYVDHCLDMLHDWSRAKGVQVTKELVDTAIYPRTETNNFAFLDACFVDRDKAIRRLKEAQGSAVHWSLFLGAVYRGLKIIIQIMILYGQGKTTSSILAKEVGGPPFTISRYLKIVPSIISKQEQVFRLRDQVVALDYGIKTGKVADSSFWVEMKKIVTEYHN